MTQINIGICARLYYKLSVFVKKPLGNLIHNYVNVKPGLSILH